FTSLAEQFCSAGDLRNASGALTQARGMMGRHEMYQGAVGSRVNYQTARIAMHGGDWKSGAAALATALAYQKNASKRLFQIGLADALYRSGGWTDRVADLVFSEVLREPTRIDWITEPLDTLATQIAPHPLPYERWFELALSRKDNEKALN